MGEAAPAAGTGCRRLTTHPVTGDDDKAAEPARQWLPGSATGCRPRSCSLLPQASRSGSAADRSLARAARQGSLRSSLGSWLRRIRGLPKPPVVPARGCGGRADWPSTVTPHASSIARHALNLVGNRADAADPGGDVGRLSTGAAAQERLEEPGRLVDVRPHLLDPVVTGPDVHGALALHPGQLCDRQDTVVVVCYPSSVHERTRP
jgi:hypothetical protein